MKTLAELVKLNYYFTEFRHNEFFFVSEDDRFALSVPYEELGGANIHAFEKGIVLMKWIRKQIKLNHEAEIAKNETF